MGLLTLSTLGHTWILDLDGTIVKHNGYKLYGRDILLDGAKEFLRSIPKEDMIIFVTSREKEKLQSITEQFLKENEIRYNHIIYNAPFGERILINDEKTSGLLTSIAVNRVRDTSLDIEIKILPEL